MAPTPDIVGPIVRVSSECADDPSTNNQYTNDAFVTDDVHNNDGHFQPSHIAEKLQASPPPSPPVLQIPTATGNGPPEFKTPKIKTETTNSSSMRQSPVESVPPNLDFDDILPHIGEFGTYQKILFFLMIPFAFSVAFVYFSQIFLTLVPDKHWCHIDELIHLPIEQRWVSLRGNTLRFTCIRRIHTQKKLNAIKFCSVEKLTHKPLIILNFGPPSLNCSTDFFVCLLCASWLINKLPFDQFYRSKILENI